VPYTTAHTGVVRGGTALNIVPDACTFEFEFRLLATDDVGSLVDEVMAHARERLEPEMRAVDPAARIVFEEISEFPGLETPASRDVVGLAKRLAGRNEHGKVAFGTEAGLFALAGIPTVVIGPGSIDQAHKADEYIVLQLEACSAFLDRLIAYSRA
jgi:acetylornithine deacetylase